MKILVLDDETVVLDLVQRLLRNPRFDLHLAENISRARDFLGTNSDYALLIADLRLPDGRGDDFIMEFQAGNPKAKVMVVSGHPDLERDIPSLEARGMGCLLKPFRQKELLRVVTALLEGSSNE